MSSTKGLSGSLIALKSSFWQIHQPGMLWHAEGTRTCLTAAQDVELLVHTSSQRQVGLRYQGCVAAVLLVSPQQMFGSFVRC